LVEPIDLASPGAAGRLKNALDAKSVAIDILVNNAGYGLHGGFLETAIERTVDMIQLNITALTELTYLFGRDMAARRSGHILLIASLIGFQAVPSYAAYAATEAYVHILGEALHDELRTHGVVVTTLCPGHTATGFDAAARLSLGRCATRARPHGQFGRGPAAPPELGGFQPDAKSASVNARQSIILEEIQGIG
jgi:short-subunit dehydrogenase